jgi:hypothetical protein
MAFITAFSDDFELGNFSRWGSVASRWTVQGDVKYAGSYAAKGQSGIATGDYLYKVLASSHSVMKISFWARASLPASKPHAGFINVNLESGMYLRAILPFNEKFTYQDPSYEAGYYRGYYYRPLPVDTAWAANTWYFVEVLIDIPNQLWHFWIDGVDKGTAPLVFDYWDGETTLVDPSDKITDLELDYDTYDTGCNIYVDQYLAQYEGVLPVGGVGLVGDGLVGGGLVS